MRSNMTRVSYLYCLYGVLKIARTKLYM